MLHRAIFVPKHTVIDLRYTDKGCRLYMAVAGGIDTPIVMGSRSTYEPVEAGSRLAAGGQLPIGARSDISERIIGKMGIKGVTVAKWGAVELLEEMDTDCIRVLRGDEWSQFSEPSRKKWLSGYFQITQASDRMGYTLSGETLSLTDRKEMISTAVSTGTVQVVPNGSPLLLMADAQTTGGYPRIAQVIDTDISTCAQKRPGDKIRFREVSEAVAQELYLNRIEERKRLEKTIRVKFSI
jgi:antagonist of KipI